MKKKVYKRLEIFKLVYPFISFDKKSYFMLGFLQIFTLVLSIFPPCLYSILINQIMIDRQINKLLYIVFGYILVYIFQSIVIIINKFLSNKIFSKLCLKIRKKILHNYMKIDVSVYESYDPADLKNRIENDVTTIQSFLYSQVLNFIYLIVYSIVICIIFFSLNAILAIIGLIMVPISFIFVRFLGKKISMLSEKQRELQSEYESFLHETFQNWKEVKLYNLENDRNKIYEKYKLKMSKLFVSKHKYWFINRSFISFKDFFITKMNLYFVGGLLIINNSLNVGVLLAFMNYYSQFFSNIDNISNLFVEFKNTLPNIERVLEILNMDIPKKKRVKISSNNIILKNIDFRYKEKYIFKNLNLNINSYEHIAIVGKSGVGKTTLSKLITGIVKPEKGVILIGNFDINLLSSESIAQKIGIVSQNPFMLNISIKENLLLGNKQVSDETLMNICKKVNMYDYIKSLPNGFDTIIGEKGLKLSGGQKQRLSIARVLIKDPDIIIFDEATSSLDSENESLVIDTIKKLSKEKTLITISHRLSAILICNKIIVIEDGSVAKVGTHKELYHENRIYNMLFEGQYNL